MPFADRMNAYYKSIHPIREHIVEWERRRRSWGFRAFTIIEIFLIVAATGSVIGVLPYLVVTNASGPLPSDTLTVISRLALPWVICTGIFVPTAWFLYRKGLQVWPQRPPSVLTPEQLTFVAAAAAFDFMDQHADSNQAEYLKKALLEVASIFDPAAEPLWRWDGDEFIAKKSIVHQQEPGFRVTLSGGRVTSDHDYLRTSWPNIVSDLRRLRRVEDRNSLVPSDPVEVALIDSLIEVGPKVVGCLRQGGNLDDVRQVLSHFRVVAFALVGDQNVMRDRPDAMAAAREVGRLGDLLPSPPDVEVPPPVRPAKVAWTVVARLATAIWGRMLVRLVVRGLAIAVFITVVVVGLRASVLPKLDDNTAAFVILGSVVLGAIGWESLVGRGGSHVYLPGSSSDE